MAKLEDLVTQTEILAAVKAGSPKNELAKKYRASEQDLALMLLPLYRKGRLTKEEFNCFFKGVPLPSRSEPDPAVTQVPEEAPTIPHEAPTEMFPAFSSEKTAEQPEASIPTPVETDSVKGPGLQLVSSKPIQAEPEAPVAQDEKQPIAASQTEPRENAGPDSAGITALLDMIYLKLNSIEERLDRIEKKLSPAG